MASLLPEGKQSFTGSDGLPLVGGKLYTYDAGTTTPRPTYSDAAGTTPNTNPVVMDARGEATIFWLGSYKVVLKDASDNTIWSIDGVTTPQSSADLQNSTDMSKGVALVGGAPRVVDSIAALRALPKTGSTRVHLTGYYTAGDGGGGLYWYDSTDTSSADNGGTIIVAADGGRWKLSSVAPLNVRQFGAKGDGVSNDTAAFQSAFSTSRRVFAPSGVYLVDTLFIPNGTGFRLEGEGEGKTVLQARSSNTTVIQKVAATGVADGSYIGNFSVKAHASGSTARAIECSGFRDSTFDSIEGLSNGTAGFYALFGVSASPYLCYKNTWIRPRLSSAAGGWTKCIDFHNNGTANALYNSNVGSIYEPWVVDNVGLSVGIDLRRSSQISVIDGLFENNAGATAIVSGNSSVIQGNWFEANSIDLDFPTGADGSANHGVVIGNYFSQQHNIDYHSASHSNFWLGNTEQGGLCPFVNSPGVSNARLTFSETYNPTAPSLSYTSGQTGTLDTLSSQVVSSLSQINQRVSYKIQGRWVSSAATGFTKFTMTIPSGFSIESFSMSMIRGVNGEPGDIGVDTDGTFWVTNKYTDAQNLRGFVVLVKTGA